MSNNHYPYNSNNDDSSSYYNSPSPTTSRPSTQRPKRSYAGSQQQQDDAMSMNNRSNQQNYVMEEMSSASRQHNAQRDTYGIPYNNNTYNQNYHQQQQQQQEQYYYGGPQPRQQQQQQQSYDNEHYYENYHSAGGDNGQGQHFDPTDHYGGEAHLAQAEPQYYNGYDDNRNSVLPAASSTQRNRSGSTNVQGSLHGSGDGTTYRGKPSSVNSSGRRYKEPKPRSKYLPCFPCIRSTCGRVSCCILLFILLLIIVLVIVIFTVFKLPTVDYLGLQGDPTFTFNQGNTTLGINLVANIQVQNPNPIGFNFESIVATAYYPDYKPSIGGGNITHVDFPAKSKKVIQFPIIASYNSALDPGFTVIQSILMTCGILGSSPTELTINYDLKVTIKIIGISISPSIKNQSAKFACPANIADITKDIPGGLGPWLGGRGG
ncbi:hypothetical protein BGZ83_000535 [Gryganskiella cystojenkinii]|nr:hypothetical protein BGZ83_000535 [Gryganskiella cystojenkinii]